MKKQFRLEGEDAVFAHMNTGTEKHGDEDAGRVDLKFEVSMNAKVLTQLLTRSRDTKDMDLYGDEEDKDLLEHIYDTHGRPRMSHVTDITLDIEFENHVVKLEDDDDMRLFDVKVNKFSICPMGGNQVAVVFRVQSHPTPEQVAKLYGWQKKTLQIDIEPGEAKPDVATDQEKDKQQDLAAVH